MARNLYAWSIGLLVLASIAHAEDVIDSPMYRNPELPAARAVPVFHERLLSLWLEALSRPEADQKIRAALTIAEGHRRGMKGLEPAITPLVRELERADQRPEVLAAIANALVTLDAKSAAPALWRAAANGDPDVREAVEPALARWNYEPARVVWLARLEQPPYRRPALLAIQGLATAREGKAASRLRELVVTRETPGPVRVEAARALGVIRESGSESAAAQLAAHVSNRGTIDRLCAASLLRQHKSDEAVRLLMTLGRDSEPTVAATALARLIEIDSKLVVPLLEVSLASPDAKVRGLAVDVLFRQPSGRHIGLLGDRLSDAHPEVRAQARRALRDLAGKAEWRNSVTRTDSLILNGSDWRGQEQAAILAGEVGHKPAAERLLKVLDGDRAEAIVAAAWALRKLALPETLPAVFEYVQLQYRRILAARPTGGRLTLTADALDRQMSQLIQFLGQSRYRAADELLRQLIPPTARGGANDPSNSNPPGHEARAASIWALGRIHEGKSVPQISADLAGRIAAVFPIDVEDPRVRRMSAVSLGLMKSTDALPTLREFYPVKRPSLDQVSNACGWAIEQITGEKQPVAGIVEVFQAGWLLSPVP